MTGRLIKDQSGMTMGLVVIMIVLIGVMGAGLLTFVKRDLDAVVEVNRGQRALEAADAGVQAAKQRLITDNNARDHFDGGADDLAWSYCYNVTGCTGAAPTSTGSPGMRINLTNGDYADVTILTTDPSAETYRVISDGRSGEARRKVEAIFRQDPPVTAPPVYVSRSDISLTGNSSVEGVSFFALGNVDFPSNSFSLGTSVDTHFGKWAAATDPPGSGPYPNAAGDYPNTFNKQPRPLREVGVGAQGFITGTWKANAFEGTRSFDRDSTPYRVVSNYNDPSVPVGQKIAFPFHVPTAVEDAGEIDFLRQRALALEQANPGSQYYIDSLPGNGVDDAGMPNRPTFDPPLFINTSSWPTGSTYETVKFYEFQTYNANNRVSYQAGPVGTGGECPATGDIKGLIVVVNGDMVYEGNRRFDGGIFVRAYDGSGNLIPDSGGLFNGAGTPCLYGYVNTSGDQVVTGNLRAGTVPEISRLTQFRGSMEMVSWREMYQ